MTKLKTTCAKEEMPRERLMQFGADKLKTHELLAILLRTGIKGLDVVHFAEKMLEEVGGLVNLSKMSPAEIKAISLGIGDAKATTLSAALEIGKRIAREENGYKTGSWQDKLNYKASLLSHEDREEIYALFLDKKESVLGEETISYGGLSGAYLDVPLLYRKAVRHAAYSVVLMHNHPNGVLTPSTEDRVLTDYIKEGLKTLEIRLKGHFITAKGEIVKIS